MNKKQIGGLIAAVVLFILTGVISVFSNAAAEKSFISEVGSVLTGGYEFTSPYEDYIAIVRVEGTIQEQTEDDSWFSYTEGYQHTTTMEYVDELMEDEYNKGILLYVDSPGGSVYESEELYWKLKQYKEQTGRPIWGYMAHYAASGGYMASIAADHIYANPNTVTGSIGVIMSGVDMSGLYEKLGIRYVSITSGANKDSSQMTEEQIAIYQSQVDECYQSFVNHVAEERDLTIEEVKALADGRTYTAKQAQENGLIDKIALYEDMKESMSRKLKTSVFYEPEYPGESFYSFFSSIENLIPKSESQILLEEAKENKNGGLMYYAEQLQ